MTIDLLMILAILAVCMIIIVGGIQIRKNKYYKSQDYLSLVSQINFFITQIEGCRKDYITNTTKQRLLSDNEQLRKRCGRKSVFKGEALKNAKRLIDIYDNLDDKVKEWNKEYIELEISQNTEFFDDIDGKSLDDEQRLAVVVDEDNNLVIAGAGSGKTLTISGKVKYLVDRKKINSEEILLLSFTRKAANEMQERISERLKINVEAKTFHKLGLEIISNAKGYRPNINSETDKIIDQYFRNEIISNKNLVDSILQFFSYYLNIPIDLDKVENLGEAHDYYKDVDLETIKSKIESLKREKSTLKGERVKSYEEVVLANFLYMNGINYEYERIYPFKQQDRFRKQYAPDFYLTDYDIYLEHFGISRDNRVPWLSKIEEKKYLEGVKWKREFHKENNTHLIETYSYYFSEGTFFTELEKKLQFCNVIFSPIDYADVYKKLFLENNDKHFNELKKLAKTFVDLFKSRGFGEEQFEKMLLESRNIKNDFFRERTKLFISIIKPLFGFYQEELKRFEQIDFNDMINMAGNFVNDNLAKLNFKYIIVDEFQDMSVSRYKLIKSIRDNTGAKTMCVGDDWQSIYRFTGSDIDLFVNFTNYFGYTEMLKIQKTYRNSQELINIAGKFVMQNPKQIKKDLRSDKRHNNPIRIFGYGRDFIQAFIAAVEEIVKQKGNSYSEIMLIGRTNYDINVFVKNKEEPASNNKQLDDFKVINKNGQVRLIYKKYPNLKMTFLTAHGSKGLEAQYVIIINMENRLLGFPNKIADDPLLGLVLTDADPFSFAEERRLFYVAITRTQNTTFLITPQKTMSLFVDELIKKQEIVYEFKTDEEQMITNPNCPKCEKGYLILRENSINNSKFLGCSNYPLCDNTFKNVEILNDQIKCSKCGGYMVKRNGSYGEFYGCTNYPVCMNTYKIERD
ncbi:UvrD-helicase domain-containing protein [Anaerotignum propionicum]|uniref:UvrD-helicase domain-containing protein n=1 Tax=Anaerotignum propionicum TaxID=28446 RepID=UPI00289715D0|nr:UvrD-helicase domain-containing protein [Anaerotignum propionicum]